MKFIKSILSNKLLLLSLGFFFLLLIIVIGGIYVFNLSTTLLLICVIVVLVLWLILLFIASSKSSKSAAGIEASIRNQADAQLLNVRASKREEFKDLSDGFLEAINALKNSNLSKQKGKAALYALPWYMFIGPPASGKTTAVINAGLNFPPGMQKEIRGVGGTRNCDWFFSSSAILLDTAGRYVSEDEDREEWYTFLDILKKYRTKQPINGVLVGISIADLANATIDKIEEHADKIRKRIDELIVRLGIRFPVYLVFTKCDLLQGFVESFGELDKNERDQALGITFHREQYESTEVGKIFEKELDQIILSLSNFRLKRLSSSLKREIRQKVFVFPIELATMKDNLRFFVDRLFRFNPYQESPLFRGFYFSSGTQVGTPLDRVIKAVRERLGIDTPAGAEGIVEPPAQPKTYFLKDLFTKIAFPDEYLVSRTSSKAKRTRLLRLGVALLSILGLGIFTIGITQGYVRSRLNLQNIASTTKSVAAINWQASGAFDSNFNEVQKLQELIDKTDSRIAPFGTLGMYRGKKAIEPAKSVYVARMKEFLNLYLVRDIENNLRYGQRVEGRAYEEKYNYLKAYLLLGNEIARLKNADQQGFINNLLSQSLRYKIPNFSSAADADGVSGIIDRQMDYFLALHATKEKPIISNDETLVKLARGNLARTPSIESIYEDIKLELVGMLGTGRLQDLLETPQNILQCDYEIPGFFTIDAWNTFVDSTFKAESSNPGKENWVLDTRLPATFSQDPNEWYNIFKKRYHQDYIRVWKDFIAGVHYIPFNNIQTAEMNLQTLGNVSASPLTQLFEEITRQTSFAPKVPDAVAQGAQNVVSRTTRRIFRRTRIGQPSIDIPGTSHPIDSAFEDIHMLVDPNNQGATTSSISMHFMALAVELPGLHGGEESLQYTQKILQSKSGTIPMSLNTMRTELGHFSPALRVALFEQPLLMSWKIIVDQAQEELNNQWNDVVFRGFSSRLQNNYPFNAQGSDASVMDFAAYFEPESGVLWAFVNEHLTPFMTSNFQSGRKWEEEGIRFSSDFLRMLRQAERIRDSFFPNNNFELSFHIRPPKLPIRRGTNPPVPERVMLQIGSQEYDWDMGLTDGYDFKWPDPSTYPGARLEVNSNAGMLSPIREDGEWAWFRLLRRATVTNMGTNFQLAWTIPDNNNKSYLDIIYSMRISGSENPFRYLNSIFNYHCPQALDR